MQARPDAHCAVLMEAHYRDLIPSGKQKPCVFLIKPFKRLSNDQIEQSYSKNTSKTPPPFLRSRQHDWHFYIRKMRGEK